MKPQAQYPGADRAAFVARVSGALGRAGPTSPTEPAPQVEDRVARVTGPEADLGAVFAAQAAAAGMTVHPTNRAGVQREVRAVLERLGVRRVMIGEGLMLEGVAADLSAAGLELVAWRERGFAAMYDADAGVTDVQGAIAETGTLVCCSGPGRARGLSLVAPIHLAVVRRSDIVPDLVDLGVMRASEAALPSSVVLITGPSKTADIEGILITGVHGPREVHVVLVNDA
ncbi:hypothetical protein PHYC_02066 [Phycisphaerales bacterium]|nr:hypothetical protein PHYC_02066 [Phycisphaerales bacterium]